MSGTHKSLGSTINHDVIILTWQRVEYVGASYSEMRILHYCWDGQSQKLNNTISGSAGPNNEEFLSIINIKAPYLNLFFCVYNWQYSTSVWMFN
jgi:hypothetical protein